MADQPTGADQPERYFDKTSGKWCYEDASGRQFEWNDATKQWQPTLESLQRDQQKAYGVDGVDEEAPAAPVLARDRKRKKGDQQANKPAKKPKEAARNTAVFVSQLPLEPPPTTEEIKDVFSKAGMILQGVDNQPKIKLYVDENGRPKGEALIVFLQEESANLAVDWFNATDFRPGDQVPMKVARAEFKDKPRDQQQGPSKKSDPEKAKLQKQADKLKKKLEGWESDDELEAKAAARARAPKPMRVVVFKHMFSLQELEDDPTLLLELKEDVRSECETLGKVTNVVLYDLERDGVMTVRFADDLSARACVQRMHGRNFGGRKIEAVLSDGKTNFRKSGKGDVHNDEAAEKERLDKFAQYLEQEGQEAKPPAQTHG